ncbi:nuclear transport factor 2 family protein [Psychromonas sp. 14N.309.X.WAT.B.A12]|uniref:nuclear transport factor 2 family protein n=1 Tax=unclassified Psychromonas TaxID=2614957 RepID=UPI0025B0D54C|nr:nuclear transport factor 2 family protein [Psychromonas sp. 14N.309.X.WAT.B.A12]MDN2662221.1 nuclear transport factor 2 family protein [Psychromonas sp. 14N.309.X.WAT.B.A12]
MDKDRLAVVKQYPEWLNRFISVYQKLSINNLDLLDEIYAQEVTFIDPIHEIKGLSNLHDYFDGLYKNLSSCTFTINDVIVSGQQAAVYWEMNYQHTKLNKGEIVSVQGSSKLIAKDNKIVYHRDFLDLGAMLYEQLPLIGKLIHWIKVKAAQ